MTTLRLTDINDVSALEAAVAYVERSFAVVPLPLGAKVPVIKGWQKLRLTKEQLPKHFDGPSNVGFLPGEASNDHVDVDLDSSEAIVVARLILPATATFGRPSALRSHYIYRCPQAGTRKVFAEPDSHTHAEIRVNRVQTLLPPSTHTHGERIAWTDDTEPADIEAEVLHHLVTLVAVAAVLARHYPEQGGRQDLAMAASGAFLQAGLSSPDAELVLRAAAMAAGDDELDKRIACVPRAQARIEAGERVVSWGGLRTILGAPVVKKLSGWLHATSGERDDGRQQIAVSNRHLRDQADDALNALVETNDPPRIFIRSGQLVRVVQDEEGQPAIDELTSDSMRGLLARAANFMRLDRLGRWVPASPPIEVVRDLLTSGLATFPALVGLVATPTLRADGSVLEVPGYDAASRLIYRPRPGFEPLEVPQEPSVLDVAEACDKLEELVGDFRFRDEASHANALALLLTPLVRQAAPGPVPLAVISAPLQGTGKSLLATVFNIVATGHRPAMMPAPKSEEEMRKRITSALRAGNTTIVFDNVDEALSSPSLALALSADVFTDRILGVSEMTVLPQRATWLATGNNVRLQRDMPRRAYWINMDAESMRPWLRTGYRHPDLADWAAAHRAELVWALLVLCRAWWAAGRPTAKAPELGGYLPWAHTVGGILAYAKIDGFLGNLEESYELADDEAEQWGTFLGALSKVMGAQPFTAAELMKRLRNEVELDELAPPAIGDLLREGARSPVAGLGAQLAREANRRYLWGSDKQVYVARAERDGHVKINRWRVVVEDAQGELL